MQVTNGQVWEAHASLSELLRERWPVKTAYGLTKLAQQIKREHVVIDAVRIQLIQQYGTTNGKGQVAITPDSPNWGAFVSAFNELMATEVEIDWDWGKVALPDRDDVAVTPTTLLALDAFVEMA